MSKTTVLAGVVLALTAGAALAQPSGAADEAAKKLNPYVYMRDAGGNKVFLESQFWRNDPNYDARVLKRVSDVMRSFSQSSNSDVDGFFFSPGMSRRLKKTSNASCSRAFFSPGKCTSTMRAIVALSGNRM